MNIFRAAFAASVIGFAVPHVATAQEAATPMTITLSSYAFAPSTVALKSGTTYKLHLVNSAAKDHNFAAPEFFAASTIAPEDKTKVSDGAVEVGEGGAVDVTVTPGKAGTYNLNCTHFMHTMLGMKGTIVVQ
jgi:plastocyanin